MAASEPSGAACSRYVRTPSDVTAATVPAGCHAVSVHTPCDSSSSQAAPAPSASSRPSTVSRRETFAPAGNSAIEPDSSETRFSACAGRTAPHCSRQTSAARTSARQMRLIVRGSCRPVRARPAHAGSPAHPPCVRRGETRHCPPLAPDPPPRRCVRLARSLRRPAGTRRSRARPGSGGCSSSPR